MEVVNKFAPLAMAWIMFVVGTSTSINQFKEVIKFPKSLLLGFLTQVVFVPIIGIVIAYLSPVSDAYKIGILLLSCVPSAVMSNYLTKTINGNTALSISLTAICSFFSFITIPFFLVLAVIFQGLLGKWTVTMLLKPAVVTLHLAGGMLILGLLAYLVGEYRPRLPKISNLGVIQKLASFAVVTVFLQIILGGWVSTNYAGLACVDFPTCHEVVTPDMNFSEGFNVFRELGKNAEGGDLSHPALTAIHMVHRVGAFVVSLILAVLAYKLIRNPILFRDGAIVVGVLLVQITLGIINVIYLLPFFAAVAHNTMAGGLLSVLVMLKSRLKNKQKSFQ